LPSNDKAVSGVRAESQGRKGKSMHPLGIS
jgi:hypothetical protein